MGTSKSLRKNRRYTFTITLVFELDLLYSYIQFLYVAMFPNKNTMRLLAINNESPHTALDDVCDIQRT
jgi:hypothetical protein